MALEQPTYPAETQQLLPQDQIVSMLKDGTSNVKSAEFTLSVFNGVGLLIFLVYFARNDVHQGFRSPSMPAAFGANLIFSIIHCHHNVTFLRAIEAFQKTSGDVEDVEARTSPTIEALRIEVLSSPAPNRIFRFQACLVLCTGLATLFASDHPEAVNHLYGGLTVLGIGLMLSFALETHRQKANDVKNPLLWLCNCRPAVDTHSTAVPASAL